MPPSGLVFCYRLTSSLDTRWFLVKYTFIISVSVGQARLVQFWESEFLTELQSRFYLGLQSQARLTRDGITFKLSRKLCVLLSSLGADG